MQGFGDEQSAPPPLTELKITWPEGCLANMLHTVSIGGFRGEPELVELGMFLMEKLAPMVPSARREHAIGVVLAKLAPMVPSKVKFTAC